MRSSYRIGAIHSFNPASNPMGYIIVETPTFIWFPPPNITKNEQIAYGKYFSTKSNWHWVSKFIAANLIPKKYKDLYKDLITYNILGIRQFWYIIFTLLVIGFLAQFYLWAQVFLFSIPLPIIIISFFLIIHYYIPLIEYSNDYRKWVNECKKLYTDSVMS